MSTRATTTPPLPADLPAETGIARWGPLVVSADVDDAIIAVAQRWFRTHLRRLREERGVELQVPREWAITMTDSELLDHPVPALVSQTAQMTAAQGGMAKLYDGVWRTDVSVTVRGRDPRETRRTASLYEGVVRRLIVQHAHIPPIDWIHFIGMTLSEVPGDERAGRYLLKATSSFEVRSHGIVDPTAGPDIPDADEYVDEPLAQRPEIEIRKEAL